MYAVKYHKDIAKTLKNISKSDQLFILSWINKNLINTKSPRIHGKSLKGEKKGLWRYRVGNYRIVANIQDKELIILIIDIGHRKNIYR
ncbi:MAG: type II toxin-antitoxin system RelE family toxin [Candidatus Arsenophonus phytopathogenicus]